MAARASFFLPCPSVCRGGRPLSVVLMDGLMESGAGATVGVGIIYCGRGDIMSRRGWPHFEVCMYAGAAGRGLPCGGGSALFVPRMSIYPGSLEGHKADFLT